MIRTLNGADNTAAAKQQQLSSGPSGSMLRSVGLLTWLNISPMLHVLLCYVGVFVMRFVSVGLTANR